MCSRGHLVTDNRNQDEIAILQLCAFGLYANLAGCLPTFGGGVLDEVVDFNLQFAAVEGDFVLVPLADWFLVGVFHLDGVTAFSSLWVGFHWELADVPDVPDVAILALGLDGARPDLVFADHSQQDAAVAFDEMAELKSKDIVSVIGGGADVAGRFAVVYHYTILDAPGFLETWRMKRPAFEVFPVEEEFRLAEVVGQVLDADVLEFNGHRRAGVKLQCKNTLHCSAVRVVVEHFDCLVAVENVNEMAASRDNGVFVPVFVFIVAGLYQCVPVGDLADDDFIALFVNHHNVTDIDHPSPAALVVEEADLARFIFDLGLVAADAPFAEVLTSVLDSGVSVVDAEFYLEDEVLRFSASPDAEGVSVCRVFLGCLAANCAVPDGPESRVAVPAGQVLAVEDADKTGLDTAFWNDLLLRESALKAQQADYCCQDYNFLPGSLVGHLFFLSSKFTNTKGIVLA